MRRIIDILLLVLFVAGTLILSTAWINKKGLLKPGYWRSVIHRPDGHDIQFTIQTRDSAGRKILYIINGAEKLLVDDIRFQGDSVYITLPFFESSFHAAFDDQGNMNGVWIKKLGDRQQVLPFNAIYNQRQRFDIKARPSFDVSGTWAVQFVSKSNELTDAVGEFEQTGNHLTGTFLTSTGDYRFLEGIVEGDSLLLSGFDGGHAYFFTAKIADPDHLGSGHFYSGVGGNETWTAHKDAQASLPDGYDQTHLKQGESGLNFTFKSIDGKMVSLADPTYKNKVIVIQLMGSWCPNCMDETSFLSNYYNHNKQKGVEVIALAYERTTDFERSRNSLERFRKRFNVAYPILVTGVTVNDPLRSEKTLPQLDNIKAFPTSIFIDKKGKVRKIYSGFEGPGTGQHYIKFQKEFDDTINALLKE